MYTKKYEELQLQDDFVFAKTMLNPKLCKKLLEMEVQKVKKNEKWRREYMTLQMRDNENIEKGRMETLFALVKKGLLSLQDAAEEAGIPEGNFVDNMKKAGYEVKR